MLVAFTVAAVTADSGVALADPAPPTELPITICPALYALGIQGTGESSPDAAPTTDTGMLSTVFRPLLALAPTPGLVERAYVPYESSFGGVLGGGRAPYADSVAGGLGRLRAMSADILRRCPETRLAVIGYSQGAHVASVFAQEVGLGHGAVAADRIAAVALFGDPTRNPGAPLFPGAPGKDSPDPAPGTEGARLTSVRALPEPPASGGGIGPERDRAAAFGALTGRVASFCAAGDLACDAPIGAPLLRAVASIAGQSELSGGDPIASLESIAQALAFTSIKTAAAVAGQDLRGSTAANLSLAPQKSISERVADAADPRSRVDLPGALQALLRVGLIGLNAVNAVIRTVLNPAAIADLATAGLSDPVGSLQLLGTRLVGSVTQLVPPTTVSRLVNQAYGAVVGTITDNAELLDATTWVRYWDTVQRHTGYNNAAVSANGQAPTRFVAGWLAAVAADLAGKFGPQRSANPPPPAFSSSPGASSTPNSSGTGQFPFGSGPSAVPADRPGTNAYPFSMN
ncbi:cutinase family protein [Nocardia panacis]|uniref:Cutinase family protein n=1 Tax=Nocardia panacis TaxID=2340916 RepID=A0A3A4K6S3_9NOCA|nr:cutinase family protein [Nocardia panacis]RJO68389.1 cutinase family protein [Nocardia panacis]